MQPLSKSKLTYFHSLQRKKYRYTHRQVLWEGKKLVEEVIQASWHLTDILVKDESALTTLPPFGPQVQLWQVATDQIQGLSTQVNPEGIWAVSDIPQSFNTETHVEGPGFVLDQLQDPGNLGTLIRTADWFGIPSVVYSKGTVDPLNSKVLRATMGSIFRVNLYPVSSLENWIEQADQSVWLADLAGAPLTEVKLGPKDFVVLGNEANGITFQSKRLQKLLIPGQEGGAESLNAAVAGSIWAWEWFRQQSQG